MRQRKEGKGDTMGTTQPIKNKEELHQFIAYYKELHPNKRNYALIVTGLNTALRISDILRLRWTEVYDFQRETFREHLYIEEKKTKKHNTIALNDHVLEALQDYMDERHPDTQDFIFSKRTCPNAPLDRTQAYRIVKKAADSLNEEHISCHSMRKTFGYHAWKQGTQPALLMDIYNHSSYRVTKHYLGIEQDERDSIFRKIDF